MRSKNVNSSSSSDKSTIHIPLRSVIWHMFFGTSMSKETLEQSHLEAMKSQQEMKNLTEQWKKTCEEADAAMAVSNKLLKQ